MKAAKARVLPLSLLILMLALGLICAQQAPAKSQKSFTSDYVTIAPGGGQEMVGKIFVSDGKVRMEMQQPGMPDKMVVIQDNKAKKAYMIMPGRKSYYELPAEDFKDLSTAVQEATTKKKLGTETISGYRCTKYEATTEMNMMGQKNTVTVLSWEAEDFLIPIRVQTPEGGVQELRNIKVGEPPANMFKVPAGYKKVANMMELMMPAQ